MNFNELKIAAPTGNGNKTKRGVYNGHIPRAFVDRDDMLAHTRDVRYSGKYDQQEKPFQAFVEECFGLTDAAMLGAGTGLLEAAMAEQPRREYQDLNGDLDKMTDTYHSVEESQADMRSPRYKTDPYFRELVARKIDRSTPNVPVVFEKHQSVKVDFLDLAAGENSEIGYVSGNGEKWGA